MDTKSVPAPPATRELRGLALFRERAGEIEHPYPGVYIVPGCKGGSYTVHLAPRERCSCSDHARHPEHSCKHIVCATIYRAKTRAARRAGVPA